MRLFLWRRAEQWAHSSRSKKGDVVFEIKVHGFPAAVAQSKEKALAHPVLAKL